MRKFFFTLFAILVFSQVNAQPPMMRGMGGFTQPFYMTESDSVAESRISEVSDILNINAKQTKKMLRLISQEYEETCRIIQVGVMETRMSGMRGMGGMRDHNFGGVMPVVQEQETQVLDTASILINMDKITEKYVKRYKKVLEDEKLAEWNKLNMKRNQKELPALIQRVSDNTENFF